jgi:hypothetical protein
MSELKVNKVTPRSGTTVTLGDSGDTITIPSGATIDLSSATQTGVGGTNTPSFRARLSADFVHNVNNTFLKVPFATEDYDTDNAYDSTTNYRFTVPSGKDGKYFVNAFLRASYNCASNISIYKNGSLAYVADAGTNGLAVVSPQITTTMNLSVSDYIEIYAFQQSGGSLTFDNSSGIYAWFEMYKLVE